MSVKSKRINYFKCVKAHKKSIFICVLLLIFPVLVQHKKPITKGKKAGQFIFRRKYGKNIATNIADTNWPTKYRTRSDTYFNKINVGDTVTQIVEAIHYRRYFNGDINNPAFIC